MLLTSFLAQARALCRAREKGGHARRAARKRPSARRATFERLEVREVLSSFSPIPGVVLASVGATASDLAVASFLDSSGKIVVAGKTRAAQDDFAALRFQANGTLDPTFGSGGSVVTPVSQYADYANAAVLYPATSTDPEKIVLAGNAQSVTKLARGQWVVQGNFALARYNGDGTLDRTFNYQQVNKKSATFGTVVTDLGGSDFINDALVQDGKIVAVGQSDASGAQCFALARYTAEGKLDSTFGGTGVVTTSFGRMWNRGEGVAIQPGQPGKILAIGNVSDGSGGSDLALARYNADGALDKTFGAGTGKVITNFDTGDEIYSVAVYPSGSEYENYIVVVGEIYGPNHGGYSNLLVARYKPDGSLDTAFGDGGLVVDRHDNVGYDVALQPDGKIVVAGVQCLWEPAFHVDFFAARYDTSGNLDPTFGSGGSVATQIPNLAASAQSVLVQSDGKIVLTGDGYDAAQRHYIALARYDTYGNLDPSFGASGAVGASAPAGAALTDAALVDASRQQLALAAFLQYEDQLQAKPAGRSKGLEVPAIDLALLDLAS